MTGPITHLREKITFDTAFFNIWREVPVVINEVVILVFTLIFVTFAIVHIVNFNL